MSFQKNSSSVFVKYDKFSGGQTTGPEESLFFVYAAQILKVLICETGPLPSLKPGGTSFNIQNPIPHKSQKAGFFPETTRAEKCQRGRGGRAERAKESCKWLPEGSDTRLGA